ncbi:hypothetical protein BU17DRAFT_93470 [Hysterangium stoloniferum]|nr:hypothetical protein BU17DRAFT_93470 [Hysterangium stoloniferum]
MPAANVVESSSASAPQCPSLPSTSAPVPAVTPSPRPRLAINTERLPSTVDSLATLVASPFSFTSPWRKRKLPGPVTTCEEEGRIEIDLGDWQEGQQSSALPAVGTSPSLKLKPIIPRQDRRYVKREAPKCISTPLHAGPLSSTRGKRALLPPGWEMHVHPEGRPYFIKKWTEYPFPVITDINIWKKEVTTRIMDFVQLLFESLNALDHEDFKSSDVELVVSISQDEDQGFYYFVDHDTTSIFWVHDLSDDEVYYLFEDSFTGDDHLELKLRQLYWVHQEYFPHHTVPDECLTELITTLSSHAVAITTSAMHTCPYDRQEVDTILRSLKNIKDDDGLVRTAVIGRTWSKIYNARFINYYGELEARIHRTQIAVGGWATHPLMKLVFLVLFDAPSVQLSTLREVYYGKVVYNERWKKCIDRLCETWGDIILQATVLLTGEGFSNVRLSSEKTNTILKANMGFLAVFNSTQQVVEENLAVTCSMASTLLSTASIVIGLLHTFCFKKHKEFKGLPVTDSDDFLYSKSESCLDLQPLAILYSLPYALLMWAMVSFITAILLYVFKSGLSTHSEMILSSLAFALGAMLIWDIRYFWQDDLGLEEDL